jgi:hypothetical protein
VLYELHQPVAATCFSPNNMQPPHLSVTQRRRLTSTNL